jgi:hypothetical protein
MNDPHVAALRYRLTVDESLEFRDPPDVKINTKEFAGQVFGWFWRDLRLFRRRDWS